MAKAPRAGEVKTRLCPPLSPGQASELYRCFLLDKIGQVRCLAGVSPVIAYAPGAGRTVFEELAPGFRLLPQRGADLGARLANSFAELFGSGCSRVLALDSDTPTLPVRFLEQAVRRLSAPGVDLVLGPSEDGGYYLIGSRALHRELFEDMPWSTSAVFQETSRRATAAGLEVACLPPWFDVDTPADLERLSASLTTPEGAHAPHTRRFLADARGERVGRVSV